MASAGDGGGAAGGAAAGGGGAGGRDVSRPFRLSLSKWTLQLLLVTLAAPFVHAVSKVNVAECLVTSRYLSCPVVTNTSGVLCGWAIGVSLGNLGGYSISDSNGYLYVSSIASGIVSQIGQPDFYSIFPRGGVRFTDNVTFTLSNIVGAPPPYTLAIIAYTAASGFVCV